VLFRLAIEILKLGANPRAMRPKKIILCVDDNEQELSILKFMLSINGYRVLAAANGQEAIAVFATAQQIDLVLADTTMPQMNGGQLVERLKRMRSHVPMILFGDAPAGGEMHVADAVLARKNCSTQELLERIKVMSARKRGPRKGAQRVSQVSELAAAS
jgi:two-component system, OmpR family, response regulator CpxR